MNYKLYYTVEGILADLEILICHTKNISKQISKFYLELQKMQQNSEFDDIMEVTDFSADELANELDDMYHDMLHIYFEDIETEINNEG